MLSHTAEMISLDCPASTQHNEHSKLDECVFSGCDPYLLCVWLPFFPDLHTEILRSWRPLYSVSLINAVASDFTSIAGSVEPGYAGIPGGGYISCVSFPIRCILLELSACFAIQTLQDYLCPGEQVLHCNHDVRVTSLPGRLLQGFGLIGMRSFL